MCTCMYLYMYFMCTHMINPMHTLYLQPPRTCIHGYVYNITDYVPYHPGGLKPNANPNTNLNPSSNHNPNPNPNPNLNPTLTVITLTISSITLYIHAILSKLYRNTLIYSKG
ncbi:hypothetical protein AAMO2058_000189900 [Amorphochlora amoebiformis]